MEEMKIRPSSDVWRYCDDEVRIFWKMRYLEISKFEIFWDVKFIYF